ncbi:MAG: hypothetical protein AB1752_01375 [Candidatus Zixiibacteriota bacterium]
MPSADRQADSVERRPGEAAVIYFWGAVFVVLMMILYIKADVILGWMESLVRSLFL